MHMKWIMWLGKTITHRHRQRDERTYVYIYVTECEKGIERRKEKGTKSKKKKKTEWCRCTRRQQQQLRLIYDEWWWYGKRWDDTTNDRIPPADSVDNDGRGIPDDERARRWLAADVETLFVSGSIANSIHLVNELRLCSIYLSTMESQPFGEGWQHLAASEIMSHYPNSIEISQLMSMV